MLTMVECWTYSFLFGMLTLNPFGGGIHGVEKLTISFRPQ